MDTISFNKIIKDFYRVKFNVEYTKDIELESEEDGDYTLFKCKIALNQADRPLTIAGQYKTIDKFIEYVLKELSQRKLSYNVKYFKLVHTGPAILDSSGVPVLPPIIATPIDTIADYEAIIVDGSLLGTKELAKILFSKPDAFSFNIDSNTGQLILSLPDNYKGPLFNIDDNGNLIITTNQYSLT